jgi:hypothetical protein
MSSKAIRVLRLLSNVALVAAAVGSSYILYEAATFPRSVQGVRQTAINLGRHIPVYGTDRELLLNHVSFVMTVSGIIVGVFAAAIVAKSLRSPHGSNQSTDPTP